MIDQFAPCPIGFNIDPQNRGSGEVREDCMFFSSEQDMGAHVPTCEYYGKGYGYCPCKNCKNYTVKW